VFCDLKAKASLSSRLEELCSELDHLRQCVQDYSFEKQNLQSKVGVLEQKVVGYEDDERTAKLMFEELKAEVSYILSLYGYFYLI